MYLLWQHERGEDHVTDGEVREEDVSHRAHRLDLHDDDDDTNIAEETEYEER